MPITLNGTLADRFNEAFEYKDGELYWKMSRTNAIQAGSVAGTSYPRGYRRVYFDGKTWGVHRIIWTMFHGEIPPKMQIDHINGNASDNRIENLRLANNADNCKNRNPRKTNTGVRNVSFVNNKYRVALQTNNHKIYCGAFDDLELAELVAMEARDKFHGKFARI